MILAWLDESGDKNCYQEKDGQTPVYVLCSWFLRSDRIAAKVTDLLHAIENNYKKTTNTRGELKGTDIIRPYESDRKRPTYIHHANKRFLLDLFQCLREHEAKVVARAFAKRTHAKYDPQNLYSFAHLTLFEQIYLLNSPNMPYKEGEEPAISLVADTLPTKEVNALRQAIIRSVKEIEKLSAKKFPLFWSFDLSTENVCIRVADILAKILFGVAHNCWSVEVGREQLYPHVNEFWEHLQPLMFGIRCDEHLKPFGERIEHEIYRVRWFPAPYKNLTIKNM